MTAASLVFHLPIGDLQRTIDFYVNQLGFQLGFGPNPRTGDTYYLSFGGNGGRIALVPARGGRVPANGRGGPAFELSTERLWTLHARLRAADVPATDVADPDTSSPHFDVIDPDGHVVRVNQVARGWAKQVSLESVEKRGDFDDVLRKALGLGDAYDGAWPTLARLLAADSPRPPRKLVIKEWGRFRSRFPDHADEFVTIAAHNAAAVDWTVRLKLDDLDVV